jgi:hypothetical protein
VNISVAGGLSTGVGYTLDGAAHNNPQQNTNLPLPFPDALQEFRVATSGLSAQNGVHSGRGRQRDHQVGVEPVLRRRVRVPAGSSLQRHQSLRRRRSRRQAAGRRLKRNQFGGTLGGPDRQEQAVLLCRVSGNDEAAAPDVEHRVRADGRHAGR